MPKIKAYTPSWLLDPAPGHQLFALPQSDPKASAYSSYVSKKKSKPGPRRTIAHRGTEVFVAVGKELRWGDLVYIKETWQAKQDQAHSGLGFRIKREDSDGIGDRVVSPSESGSAQGYRMIKTPVADDIRQLIISPNSNYLAVLTTHTVHICLLPDSSHLTAEDNAPLKPKFYTLGPTTHVTSRSAVVSALWHPLGVNGSTLVTITEDAVVRLWELSTPDRWSFDSPTLAIDLRKLADGASLDQDFSASTTATNAAFSPDSFEMEIAAASFGGRGAGGWSPMTLWIAMRGGDVYALCPLLPQKWAPPPTLIPSLSVSIVAKVAAIEDDPEVSPQAKLLAQQQLEWMSDLDNQQPKVLEGAIGDPVIEVYTRPSKPGAVPKLQGPFDLDLDPENDDDLDTELTDIFVIGEKIRTDDLMLGEEDEIELDETEQEGLSLSVVCLLSTSGQLRICLDLDGVEAQWLPPSTKSRFRFVADVDPTSLLCFQTLDTLRPMEVATDAWPTFSEDVTSRYSFYVTHSSSITYISLSPWVFRLESELQGASQAGSEFRIDLLVKGQSSTRERLYSHPLQDCSLASCTTIRDPDLGYFVLSATQNEAIGLTFETPEDSMAPLRQPSVSPERSEEEDVKPLVICAPRPVFQASNVFDQNSDMPRMLEMLRSSRYKHLVSQEVKLSAATLKIFTDAHQLLSAETSRVNSAAAELFRKCERLQGELREQITKANMVKQRIDKITGDDAEEGDGMPDNIALKQRLERAKSRQKELNEQAERIKRMVGRANSRPLSDKERGWIQEVETMEANLLKPEAARAGPSKVRQPWQRYDEVKAVRDELVRQAERIESKHASEQGGERSASTAGNIKVPSEIRKAKVGQVMTLLERETMLIDAVKGRLARLSVGSVG